MQRSNLIKKLLVVANIICPIVLATVIVINNPKFYPFFWMSILIILMLTLVFISEVDKGNVDSSKKEEKIKRWYSDVSCVSTVIYGISYLTIEALDVFKIDFKKDIRVIIGFFIITIFYELIIYHVVDKAKKETAKLLP